MFALQSAQLNDPTTKEKLKGLAELAINRAELLQSKSKHDDFEDSLALLKKLPPVPETLLSSPTAAVQTSPTISDSSIISPGISSQAARPSLYRGSSAHLKVTGGIGNYTEEEKRVLYHTSHINDNEFVPFMSGDLTERFQLNSLFIDKDGLLELAPKQRIDFARWARPSEIFISLEGSTPVMVMGNHVDYHSIKQTVCINYYCYNYYRDCHVCESIFLFSLYFFNFYRWYLTVRLSLP